MRNLLINTAKNFAAILLLLVLPALCIGLRDIPQRIAVTVKSADSVIIKSGSAEKGKPLSDDSFGRIRACGGDDWYRTVWFNYGSDHRFDNTCFQFEGDRVTLDIADIYISHHVFFQRRLDLMRLKDRASTDGLILSMTPDGLRIQLTSRKGTIRLPDDDHDLWKPSRLDTQGILLPGYVGLILGLLILSVFLTRVRGVENWKPLVWQSLAVAFLFAFFVGFVLPYQTFTVNRSYFAFGNGDFCLAVLVNLAILFTWAAVGLIVCGRRFGWIVHLLLLSFVTYEYLNTGILAVGEPPLDGNMWYYCNQTLGCVNYCVLAAVFVLPLILYKLIKNGLCWWTLILFVLIGASLFDVKQESGSKTEKVKNELSDGYFSQMEIVKHARFSPKRNVMVFVLDSTPGDAVKELMQEHPELAKEFPGFVAYDNIGMHRATWRGLPSMFTGEYIHSGESMSEHMKSIFETNSVIYECYRRNVDTYVAPSLFEYGYCNRITNSVSETKVAIGNAIDERMIETPYFTLYEAIRFRMTPFALKNLVMSTTWVGIERRSHVDDEAALVSMLSNARIDDQSDFAFHVYHTVGCHLPVMRGRKGNLLSSPNNTYAGLMDVAYYVLDEMGKLMQRFRESGIYDNSLIILTADHGNEISRSSLPAQASTLLWVKPAKADGELAFSELTTSHAKIKPLLMQALAKDLSRHEIESILHTKDRIFTIEDNGKLTDWLISGNEIRQIR